jgi:hypothetical protein
MKSDRELLELAAVHLTEDQRTDLLAAAFYIAAKDDDSCVLKENDAERIIGLLTELAGVPADAYTRDHDDSDRWDG